MGACTVTIVKTFVIGDRREVIADVSPSSSYAAGGDTLTAAQLGLSTELDSVDVLGGRIWNGTLSFAAFYDHTNNKLVAHGTNATPGAAVGDPDVTATTNLSGYTGRVRAVGKP